MRITVTEWNDLLRLGRAIRQAEEDIRHEGAAAFRDLAREEAPKRTGFLVENIVIEEQGDKTDLVIALAFYAFLVNAGTRYQAANPFWDRASLRFGQVLDAIVARHGRKLADGA